MTPKGLCQQTREVPWPSSLEPTTVRCKFPAGHKSYHLSEPRPEWDGYAQAWHDRPVPNTPGTPRRTIRVSDELWSAAQVKAQERGEDLSAVIRKALERYVRRSK